MQKFIPAVTAILGMWLFTACNNNSSSSTGNERISILDFGAVADGKTDNTLAIQQAMQHASENGGGIVRVPVGQYLVKGHLEMPRNVSLEGEWLAPHMHQEELQGSVLLAVEGKGDTTGAPFITMKMNSTIKGLTIFYPEQEKVNPPHPYPWTIATREHADNCSIIDVTLINPYMAVDFGTFPTGRHLIRNLYGYPLYKGLFIHQCYDVGRIENIHFWPFWDLNPESPLWEFTRTKGTAFIFGRTDGQIANNLFCIFYKTGIHFLEIPRYTKEGKLREYGTGAAGVFTNCYIDVTPNAVRVDAVMENAGVSFVNGMFMSGIEISPRNRGPVKFTGCGFWSNNDQTFHAKTAGVGTVMFNSCTFYEWDKAKINAPCIEANSKQLIISSNEFHSAEEHPVVISLGPAVESAVISSNLFPRGYTIDNKTKPDADIQTGLNAAFNSYKKR